ncbi:putative toxin [Longispora fulva]|uniref:mRNA interferase MazF n=1 Tax=Longispora fulva TaxID=619741 RepID=A0A8J7KSN8_9ACTN|nr:type II toxin-antitoxin system PemK/MazF family toxin [Longispora fulva]MBG6139842.1 mRNA interferase MazF [Longispora fulva]GIG57773.1 putative toxin [Longispora fulva]
MTGDYGYSRGEVFRIKAPRDQRGHEQDGTRYAVIVQANHLLSLSTVLVAPTSTSSRETDFRPEVEVRGKTTRVLVEQTRAVDPGRLGESVGWLTGPEMAAVDQALKDVLGLP